MRRYGLGKVSAAALALALLGSPLAAQGFEDATAAGLAKLGIQAPVEAMTVEQQAQIQNVISSSDSDATKRARIATILGNEATETGRLGVGQLQSSVRSDLARLGIPADGVEQLTLTQLSQIENVVSGSDSDDVKKMRVEEILGNEATATGRLGVAQLQDSVAASLAGIGMDAAGVEGLSITQLGQIENVFASGAPDAEKKAQITTIMAQ